MTATPECALPLDSTDLAAVRAERDAAQNGAISLRLELSRQRAAHCHLQLEHEKLRTRIAELEADAARYRWLREQQWNESLLDKAIDKARAALGQSATLVTIEDANNKETDHAN